MRKPITIIESPFGKNTDGSRVDAKTLKRNIAYLRAALEDSLMRGEAPFASHGLYPQVFDDADAEQRRMGMEAGWEYIRVADQIVVYHDYGITPGMMGGIERANENGVPVYHRRIISDDRDESLLHKFFDGWVTGLKKAVNEPSVYARTGMLNQKPPRSVTHPESVYIENPPKRLPPSGWVPVDVPDRNLSASSKEDLVFLQRLRQADGFFHQRNEITSTFHGFIRPNSEAAQLFCRWLMRSRGLPPHHEEIVKLLPEGAVL